MSARSQLLIDGYNLLLALAHREGVRDPGPELAAARSRLLELLSAWSELRDRPVTVVWDGAGSLPAGLSARLRVVFVEPPAEADDWIAGEATALTAAGHPPAVFSRDQGLLRRLPAACERISLEEMVHDLDALSSGPLTASHVAGPDDPLAEPGWLDDAAVPVDTARLPRRRAPAASRAEPIEAQRSAGASSARRAGTTTRPAAGPESDARAAAREARDARRRRHERAEKRRRQSKKKKK